MPQLKPKPIDLYSISFPKEVLSFQKALRGKKLIEVKIKVFLNMYSSDRRTISLGKYVQSFSKSGKPLKLRPHHASYSADFTLYGDNIDLAKVFMEIAHIKKSEGFSHMYVNVTGAIIESNGNEYTFTYKQRKLRLSAINGEAVNYTKRPERDKLLRGDLSNATAERCTITHEQVIQCS